MPCRSAVDPCVRHSLHVPHPFDPAPTHCAHCFANIQTFQHPTAADRCAACGQHCRSAALHVNDRHITRITHQGETVHKCSWAVEWLAEYQEACNDRRTCPCCRSLLPLLHGPLCQQLGSEAGGPAILVPPHRPRNVQVAPLHLHTHKGHRAHHAQTQTGGAGRGGGQGLLASRQ